MEFDVGIKTSTLIPDKRPAELSDSKEDQTDGVYNKEFTLEALKHAAGDSEEEENSFGDESDSDSDDSSGSYDPVGSFSFNSKSDSKWPLPKTSDEPAVCNYCNEVADHFFTECKNYKTTFPPPPPPTPEDVEKKRAYCRMCAKYVDHGYFECPYKYILSGIELMPDGSYRQVKCEMCGEKVHPKPCGPPNPFKFRNPPFPGMHL